MEESKEKKIKQKVNFPSETVILGFTGPLGSGCTYISQEVANNAGLFWYSLSQPIHEEADRRDHKIHTFEILQSIGDEFRKMHGADYLAVQACSQADEKWAENPEAFEGIVLDGIRNSREVDHLRQFPNFFLFAVHASAEIRLKRLLRVGKVSSEDEFRSADKRDAQEKWLHGQQVKECTDRADVIFNNENDIAEAASGQKKEYIRKDFIHPYVELIQKLLLREAAPEHQPTIDETLMTMAYAASKRSRCVKRKVGAIVANKFSNAISAGFNDVPEGVKPCVFDPELNGCLRDKLQEESGAKINNCPKCGTLIKLPFKCFYCQTEIPIFSKHCKCGHDPEIEYICENSGCKTNIFEEFVPGAQAERGKLLDMCRSLHAEENALLYLARDGSGVPAEGVLYTTTFPCNLCANKIVAAGISKVVYAEPYPMPEAIEVLKKGHVDMVKFQGVKSSAFFRLYR
jgi:deoxycytidylate deaminase